MKYKNIIERVSWGEEFFFLYNNEKYWISQNGSGFYLTRVRGSVSQSFKTAKELFEMGFVEGRSISEIWKDIEEYF